MATSAERHLMVDSIDQTVDFRVSEKRGRKWLLWSFIFCPCHLPVSMAVLATIFGGSTFGALISRNTLVVGLVFGVIYAVGVGIGFIHLRKAAKAKDCSDYKCEI